MALILTAGQGQREQESPFFLAVKRFLGGFDIFLCNVYTFEYAFSAPATRVLRMKSQEPLMVNFYVSLFIAPEGNAIVIDG
ncbi:MAG: hypothetical protein ACMUIL_12860 [bacterium]